LLGIILKFEQRANGIKIKTQFAAMSDKREPAKVASRKKPSIGFRSGRAGEKTNFLIKAYGRDFDSATLCGLSDCYLVHAICSSSRYSM
jgi:hypothetical protein